MARYRLTSPDGQKYILNGPDGASDAEAYQALQQYLGTNAQAAAPPAAPAQDPDHPKTFGDAAMRALKNLPGDALDTAKGIETAGLNLAFNRDEVARGLVNAAGPAAKKVADVVAGGLQHVRELSPAQYQGSAPAMDKAPFDAAVQDVHDKYLTKEGLYKTVSDHPVGAALDAATVAAPALKALRVGEALAPVVDAASAPIRRAAAPLAAKVDNITGAERRAQAASARMRGTAQTDYSAAQAAADAQAADATAQAAATTDRAKRAADLAERAKARQAVLAGRQAEAAKAAVLPEPTVGTPASPSDIGAMVRDPALAKQSEIEAAMHAADAKYRDAMEAVAADQAKAGVGVSDTDTAKALIKKSQGVVRPDPVTRPDVGGTMANSAGAKLHGELLDALEPQKIPLTKEEAVQSVKAGNTVTKAPDGSLYRTIKPDLKKVDDFRRYVGQVLDGKVEGYAGLNTAQAREMYAGLTKTIDEYVSGASQPVQANWRAGKKALEPYENVRAGQAVVGMQKGAGGQASVATANLPSRMLAGGRDTVDQVRTVAGPEPVSAALRSQLQNELTGLKGSAAIQAKVAPTTKLGEVVATEPDLLKAVQEHIANTQAAEAKGVEAANLGQRAATSGSRADMLAKHSTQLDKAAEALQGTSAKAASTSDTYARGLANLEIAPPKEVGKLYTKMLEDAHKSGRISVDQYLTGKKLAASAESDFALKASRDKWMRRAGMTIGLAALPYSGYKAVSILTPH